MKLVKEKLNEKAIGKWKMTEVTAAGTVTRDESFINDVPDFIYVKESINEATSHESLKKDAFDKRKKELKLQGYFIDDSKISDRFTAKKDDDRIVVSLDKD